MAIQRTRMPCYADIQEVTDMVMTLTPDQQQIVQHLVERYKFDSAGSVIDEALALLAEQRHTERLRRLVAQADDDIAHGRVHPFTPELMERIKANGKRILNGEIEPDSDAWW
jgi:Arc/MetJ-type ribon-helix-helix transcriptional regulator